MKKNKGLVITGLGAAFVALASIVTLGLIKKRKKMKNKEVE